MKVLSSMSGEALEEVFSGIVDPALESIYNGKDVRDNYSKETAAEIAYSALIGGILGGLGGSVDLAKGNVSELDTTPRKLDGSPIVTRTAQTDNAPRKLDGSPIRTDPRFATSEQTERAQAQMDAAIRAADNAPRMLNGQPITPRTAAQTATDTTAATGANLGAKNAPDGATQTITSRQNIQRYSDDIDAVFKGDYPSGRVITMGETPDLLLRYGASQRPVTLTQEAAYKIAYPEGYMGGKHNLGMSALKQLPYQIADPVAIMRSTSEDNSLVLLTAWKDGNTDVIIPLHLDKTGAIGLENRVPSAYGKGNIDAIIGKNNENVLYTKNNEDIHQLLSKGVQFPPAMADDILAKNSIPDAAPKVNMENAAKPDTLPLMLNGQPIAPQGTQTDTNGPQGTEADRAPRMLDGTPIGPKAEIVKPAAQGSMYLPTVEEVMARNAPVQTADLNASGQEGTGAEARLAENAPESYLDMAAEYANPIALDNIRRRLKAMCGGTLEIEPREQGGTRVTVFVPQNPPPGSIQCL